VDTKPLAVHIMKAYYREVGINVVSLNRPLRG